MQVLNDIMTALIGKKVSQQVGKRRIPFLINQLVPEPMLIQTTSIQEHIHFYQVNKFQTVRSKEQTKYHIDMSTHSNEIPFDSIPSFHRNQIEDFEYEKPFEEVVHVYKVCKVDDAPLCLDKLFKDDLVAHTPSFLARRLFL